MMLEERDKALIEEEQKREQERKNLLKYSMEIRAQLEERETVRAREVEKIEEEAIAMKRALVAIEKVKYILEFFCPSKKKKKLIFKFPGRARKGQNTQCKNSKDT